MALLGTLSIVLEVKLASVQTQFPLNVYLTAGFVSIIMYLNFQTSFYIVI